MHGDKDGRIVEPFLRAGRGIENAEQDRPLLRPAMRLFLAEGVTADAALRVGTTCTDVAGVDHGRHFRR